MAEGRPITTSRFYVDFNGDVVPLKSVQEVSFQGQVKGNDKALMSMKNGKTIRQSTSTGFEENPNLTVEVYLMEDDKYFYDWIESTMPTSYGGEGKWADNRKTGSIFALDPSDAIVMQWDIQNAWVKSYKISDFSSDSSDLAYETFELVCEDIKRVK